MVTCYAMVELHGKTINEDNSLCLRINQSSTAKKRQKEGEKNIYRQSGCFQNVWTTSNTEDVLGNWGCFLECVDVLGK